MLSDTHNGSGLRISPGYVSEFAQSGSSTVSTGERLTRSFPSACPQSALVEMSSFAVLGWVTVIVPLVCASTAVTALADTQVLPSLRVMLGLGSGEPVVHAADQMGFSTPGPEFSVGAPNPEPQAIAAPMLDGPSTSDG